jgi:hypothetical protein
MLRKRLTLALVAAGLGSCGPATRHDAAQTASRLLAAVVHGDRAAFEAAIDRPAVRDDVRRQMAALAQAAGLEVDGGPSEFALDRMITPEAIALVGAESGQALTVPPTPRRVAAQMKRVGDDRACLREAPQDQTCALTFARSDDRWRLVGMKAMGLTIEVPEAGD